MRAFIFIIGISFIFMDLYDRNLFMVCIYIIITNINIEISYISSMKVIK